jgi:fibro-slime domain-containing protein
MRLSLATAIAALAAFSLGCGARSEIPTPRPKPGEITCVTTDTASLRGRIRDFSSSHPDFENFIGDDQGIVSAQLGADGTPVYAPGPSGTTPSTSGQAHFDQWFHDTPGVNLGMDFDLPLAGDPAAFAFDDDAFFPIDGMLLGDEDNPHNFHFTLELHGKFRYQGGEVFDIAGDDDLWLFVAGHLAVDLGGVHGDEAGSANVDALAGALGLVQNEVYALDVFFAERHTSESALHLHLSGPDLCVAE